MFPFIYKHKKNTPKNQAPPNFQKMEIKKILKKIKKIFTNLLTNSKQCDKIKEQSQRQQKTKSKENPNNDRKH